MCFFYEGILVVKGYVYFGGINLVVFVVEDSLFSW